jgi:thioredoxin reductase
MKNNFEVLIIGGSYAGLAAAMALGRASRNVLVIDSGKPCNSQTPHSHNFITQDGEAPAVISAKAKAQVMHYPTVQFLDAIATSGTKTNDSFTINTDGGQAFTAQKLLLATGIKDIMPNIKGIAECWGISVIHCPYCHGYEVKNTKTAILANGDAAYHYCMLLTQWSKDLTVFSNGKCTLTDEQLAKLKAHSIYVIETEIDSLQQTNGQLESITLKDGKVYPFTVMYHKADFVQHSDIPLGLGCATDEGGFIIIDAMQKTTIAGIFAAGDCTTPMRAVANAVAGGTKAGAFINHEMAAEAF